ncbi:exodeoxyribonuclease VII small subunit [Natronorubrum sp. A-ect3]|uniref:exodeoxyribonuclease VII small subunit n=1 Tax=Natronorubrum sp. A-ect3 TaxID=3242698 RepID=UPI00359DB9BD
MSDSSEIPADASISDKTNRLEEIIAQLEDGELSLERANELHTEGTRLLAELEKELDIGDGEIIEWTADESLESED